MSVETGCFMESSSPDDPLDASGVSVEDELGKLFRGDSEEAAWDACDKLIRIYKQLFRGNALRYVGGHIADADDLMQDFTKHLISVRKRYNPEKGAWIAWARIVLRGCATGFLRAAATRNRHIGSGDGLWEGLVAPDRPQWIEAWTKQVKRASGACLDALDDSVMANSYVKKAAFILRVFKGMKLQDIAVVLDIGSPSTVHKYVAEVADALRECMKRKGFMDTE
jgi:RNA polymerase sigma factor (sigma-70 family)